jgi:lactoylglutathione lyase
VPTASKPEELENTMDTSQPFISAIATIGIPVTDQDRALEFYTDTLGMEKQPTTAFPPA